MLGDDREKAVKTVARRAKEAIEAAKKEKRNQANLNLLYSVGHGVRIWVRHIENGMKKKDYTKLN